MSPRTGRPPSDNPRQWTVETRLTREELEKLDFCCRETGKTRSEVIREGIDKAYARLKASAKK